MSINGVFYSGGTGGTGLNLTSGDVTRINISTGGTITFNNEYSFPTTDGVGGGVLTTNGSGVASFIKVENSSLTNSSIIFSGDIGEEQTMSLGETFTIEGSTGIETTMGEDKVLIKHADTSTISPGDYNYNRVDPEDGVVIQGFSLTFDSLGHTDKLAVSTINLDTRYDARYLSFKTINVPTGTDPVADVYNDTLNLISSDSSVVISGNSTSDTIDIKVGSGVNTNIYNSDLSLSGNRTLSQSGNTLTFDSNSSEQFRITKTASASGDYDPRLFIEADSSYDTVLELESSEASTYYLRGRDTAGDVLFSIDGLGNLVATSKSFLIKHPTKENYALRYGSLEGPEHGVYVRGRLSGNDTIELPDYWVELINEDTITVQLTPIGKHQNLYVKDIVDNKVIVANGSLLSNKINCFYFIQAERKDIEKMVVEYPTETNKI